jgi:hypothetical protein
MNIVPIIFSDNDWSRSEFNNLYRFYEETWAETWKELKVEKAQTRDDFLRFKTKLGLFLNGKPIAFHGYGEFDLSDNFSLNNPYFNKINVDIVGKLLKKGITKIATLEYMTVHPEYRKFSGLHLGEILGGFSTQLFRNSSYSAVLTISRNDRGINNMCKMYGAYPLYENIPMHNVTVDVMVFETPNIKNNPKSEIQKIINYLLEKVNNTEKKERVA